MKHTNSVIVILLFATLIAPSCNNAEKRHTVAELPSARTIPSNSKSQQVVLQRNSQIREMFLAECLPFPSPIFIRIFKEESELEMWVEKEDGKFLLLKSWPVCKWSGKLGPKLQEGDRQSPEGFYFVTPSQMHPESNYHLAFNIGFPNEYDRIQGRTGSDIMVHGICGSLGCYAMTNQIMEEIWTVTEAALRSGQPFFRVHIFPFRMTDAKMKGHQDSEWLEFWKNLREGYNYFEEKGFPPNVSVVNRQYRFN